MAKSNKVAKFLKKAAKRRAAKEPKKARSNPSTTALMELGTTVGAGAGAYAANRLGTALIVKLLGNRLGAFGRHLSPLASVGLAALIWYIAEKWSTLRRHGTSVIVGSGIAVVQTVLNRYLPGIELLLNAGGQLGAPRAVGEYVEDDDDDYALPGQNLSRPALAPPDDESNDDIMSSTGIFSGSV